MIQIKKTILTLVALIAVTTGAWAQPWTSGDCSVTLSGGTLTISGTGAMEDYANANAQPWSGSRTSITSIVVEEGVTHIGNSAFRSCSKVTSISLPTSLTSIGDYAFQACNNAGLTSIPIPENVESIGNNAFLSCVSLTTVTIPDKVTTIGNSAFYNCTGLTSVTIGNSVTSIGQGVFQNCSNLTTVTVKAPSCTLGTYAFNDCTSLTAIYVPSGKVDTYKGAENWSNYATYIHEPAASGPEVTQVPNTTDEWQFTMPAGNVLVDVEYKDLTAMALTFGGKAIPEAGVKGFLGFEQEFIDGLNLDAAVTNTDQNGAAVTTDATSYTYTSSDATVIGFKTATEGVYAQSGALADMEFRQEGSATLTIQYAGTEDLGKSAETVLLVTVTEKTYTVELADNTADADNWQGKIGDNGTYAALPVEGLKGSEKVVLKYDGSRIVKRVTATSDAAPATVPVTAITLNKTETTITMISGTATETLSVTAVTPDEATDKTYTWSSDDITKATVDQNGVVTAVAAGTAHIRATANDGSGVYGECTVTVSDLSAYYSKMVECGCDDLDGKCWTGGSNTFTGQVLSAAQAIALAQAKAAETSSNCAVFYGGEMGNVYFAKNDGTTGSARFYYDAGHKGLSGYRGFYVSK